MFMTNSELVDQVEKLEADIKLIKTDLSRLVGYLTELADEQNRYIDFVERKTNIIIEKHNALVEYVVPPRTFDWAYRQAQGIYGR